MRSRHHPCRDSTTLRDLSGALSSRDRFSEKWDDEGIGRSKQVWSDGTMSSRDSTTLRDVSDALSPWNRPLLSPIMLTWNQVADPQPTSATRSKPQVPAPPAHLNVTRAAKPINAFAA